MPSAHIVRESPIVRTVRVAQIEGLFDVQPSERSGEEWTVNLPLAERDWNIGLIVGPSGSGKSTIARELFGANLFTGFKWSKNKTILDDFPASSSIKEIGELLSSVGFSSVPLWLRPYPVLSTGQQMRVNVARLLASNKDLIVMDEFSSVVDRTVAQIGSAAIAKTIRRRNQKFIAVTCHADVTDWLQPDWIYQPAINQFGWRSLQRRPDIVLDIVRADKSLWRIFKAYHYLDSALVPAAQCFVGLHNDLPVVFTAVLHFPHPSARNIKREHRTVCLPDYQGVGIGNVMSDTIAAMCKGCGWRYLSITSHPAMMTARIKSSHWRLIAKPNIASAAMTKNFTTDRGNKKIAVRLRATFEFVGQGLAPDEARQLWGRPIGEPRAPIRARQSRPGNVQGAQLAQPNE